MKVISLLMIALAIAATSAEKLSHHQSNELRGSSPVDHEEHDRFPLANAAVEQTEEHEEQPPRPYSFTYQAGRYPNHVDRSHSEVRGADGLVTGNYEYLDPLRRLVRVDYTVDQYGYHPIVQGPVPQPPKESDAVARARQRHEIISQRIIAEQARIGEEHQRLREQQQQQQQQQQYHQEQQQYHQP